MHADTGAREHTCAETCTAMNSHSRIRTLLQELANVLCMCLGIEVGDSNSCMMSAVHVLGIVRAHVQ